MKNRKHMTGLMEGPPPATYMPYFIIMMKRFGYSQFEFELAETHNEAKKRCEDLFNQGYYQTILVNGKSLLILTKDEGMEMEKPFRYD